MQTKVITENLCRLEKFQTKTVLSSENGHQVIRRCPVTETARPFINTIAHREKASQEYLKGHFDVLCGVLEDGCLKYDYLPYQSLLRIIETQFRQNCPSMVDKTVRAYVNKIKALQSTYTVPEDFYQTIGLGNAYDNTRLLCLSRGLLDLTPRNILANGEHWIAIDFEWAFDFAVPMAFVLFRAIKEIVVELQYEIRRHTGRTRTAVPIFARGRKTYYFPESWVEYIVDNHISFAQMLRWEMGLQQYVAGSSSDTAGRVIMRHRTKFHFSVLRSRGDIRIVESASHFLKKLPFMRRLVHFSERVLLYLQK